MTRFLDRADAGKQLAQAMVNRHPHWEALVLALPRGGVPVAFEIAHRLGLPLDILPVRKLGVPGQPELAMGAIAEGNVRVLNADIVRQLFIPPSEIDRVAAEEGRELQRRGRVYRSGRAEPRITGRTVILVDDGCATGANMRAAIEAARAGGATRIVVAVPVASREADRLLRTMADEVVCLAVPVHFGGVGQFYADFSQVTDDAVRWCLAQPQMSSDRRVSRG